MPSSRFVKLASVIGLVALALAACGRRGSLEAPGGAAPSRTQASFSTSGNTPRGALPASIGPGGAGAAEPDPEAVAAGDEVPLSAQPPAGTEAPVRTTRGAKRGYQIPKEPFILDPLL